MQYSGIDYSLTCPCLCIMDESGLLKDCEFFYLTSIKKAVGAFFDDRIFGVEHKEYTSEQQRYSQIADFFVKKLPGRPFPIMIEDYSFGSKGKVFHIAENTGILKHKLWENAMHFETVPPTVVKKFATGKGNANKDEMYGAFVEQNGIDIHKMITPNKKLGSPATDIVDAYFIAKYLREKDIARRTTAAARDNSIVQ